VWGGIVLTVEKGGWAEKGPSCCVELNQTRIFRSGPSQLKNPRMFAKLNHRWPCIIAE
jgi:hypothetical protein